MLANNKTTILVMLILAISAPGGQVVLAAPDDAAAIERLLKRAPNSYETHLKAGQFYLKEGSIGQAQDEFRIAIKCKNPGPEAFKQLALLNMRSHDYDQSTTVIEQAVKLFPREYGVFLTAGYVMHNQTKLAEALTYYNKAMAIQPTNPEIYLARADLLNAMNKYPEALAALDKAKNLGHLSKQAEALLHFVRAKVYINQSRYADAAAELNINYKADPETLSNNKLYLTVLDKLGKKQKELEVALIILSADNGQQMQERKALIGGLIKTLSPSQIEASLKAAENLIKAKQFKARMHFAMGDIMDRQARYKDAIQEYRRGLAINPDFARGYLRLGEDLEMAQNDFAGAMLNYKKALALDKNDKETKMRIKALIEKQKKQKSK